jgi:hypothetical protein
MMWKILHSSEARGPVIAGSELDIQRKPHVALTICEPQNEALKRQKLVDTR